MARIKHSPMAEKIADLIIVHFIHSFIRNSSDIDYS
ncbi:Uncharacterised protein [Anaerobiospirillum thomasii]|uniref:Uncharacterized protein n=1 Tax=Anaerobiospirillum thomasii TaxID=179995 RepID=A0A2X0VBG4_9GAMM|nr:Uncharacterised protein [Anaerobiospirillum thomasii]